MKLIQILAQLDKKTLQNAHDFVNSPYHNKSEKLILAFSFLVKELSKGNEPNKFDIWTAIDQVSPFNDGKFRKLIHDLLALLKSFFAHEVFKNDTSNELRALTQYCQQNDLFELLNFLNKEVGKKDLTDYQSSTSIHDIYSSMIFLNGTIQMFEQKRRKSNSSDLLTGLDGGLTFFYLIEKIRLLLSQKNLIEEGQLEKEIIEWTPNKSTIEEIQKLSDENTLLNAYFKLYQIRIQNQDFRHISSIIESLNIIAPDNLFQATEIYTLLYNEIAIRTNLGSDLSAEAFELSKLGVSSGILIKNDKIDPISYRNIILFACRQNDFQWALDFAEEYKSFLEKDYRQSAYSFNKARIYINMKDYDNAVHMLRDVEYEDVTYNINSKLMLISSFYELDEYETLVSTINAFKVFLRRRRNISVKRKANFGDYCDIVYNLVRAQEKKDVERYKKAEAILANNTGIPSRWWLQEKIAEVSDILGIKEDHLT